MPRRRLRDVTGRQEASVGAPAYTAASPGAGTQSAWCAQIGQCDRTAAWGRSGCYGHRGSERAGGPPSEAPSPPEKKASAPDS